MMSDCLQLTMIFPFILNRFLKNTHFRSSELALFQRRTGVTRSDLAVNLWLKCWIVMAKTMAMVFKILLQKMNMVYCVNAYIMNDYFYYLKF